MIKLKETLRRYPLSCLCIAAIWVLCLMPVPETPLDDVRFIDKWVHIVMYGGLGLVVWTEYLLRHKTYNWHRLTVWAWLAPVVMGGAVELAQAYCTDGRRSGDWLDFAANSLGATLAMAIGSLVAVCLARRNRGSL